LKRARSKVAKRRDVDHKPHEYQVGDAIVYWVRLASSKANNISAKFLLSWPKPVVISKIVKPDLASLANPETGEIFRRAHVSQLKAFVR
jgi:hypothetical protein